MSDDPFGFGKGKGDTLSKLANIKPKAEHSPTPSLEEIDAAGQRAGFQSREPGGRTVGRRRRQTLGPMVTINTRVPEDIAERFINFCDRERFAYWEGIKELMDRAKV